MKSIILSLLIIILVFVTACSGVPGDIVEDSKSDDTTQVVSQTEGSQVESETEESQVTTEEVTEAASETTAPVVEEEVLYDLTFSQGTIAAATGKAGTNKTRLLINETFEIENFSAITIAKGYQITWLAYGVDNIYLGNGSNTYPKMPSGGVWLGEGIGVPAEEILEWNSDTKYVRFVVKRVDGAEIQIEKDAADSEVKVYASGYVEKKPFAGSGT